MEFLELSLVIVFMAFICEYIDSSIGMGYGTTLTPLLLLMGYQPLQIVPSILLSELISGLSAGFFHHRLRNVDFKFGGMDFKIVSVVAGASVFGAIIAVFIALNIPTLYLKLYIGMIVLGMGLLILLSWRKTYRFSWKKIGALGLFAAFNKGASGGGYGPVVTSGQILSGVNSKNAIGITSVAEGLTCIVGVAVYFFFTNHTVDWSLAPSLILGAILSVPVAAFTVKKMKGDYLKLIVGVATVLLGLLTLGKIIL